MRSLGWVAIGAVLTAVLAFLIIDTAAKDDTTTGSAPDSPVLPGVTTPAVAAPPPSGSAGGALPSSIPAAKTRANPSKRQEAPRFALAIVRPGQRIALYDSPGGRMLQQVGYRTEFKSTRVFWIARAKGGWLGVPTPDLPNNRLAWIPNDRLALEISQTQFWISADISRRLLELHHGNRILERMRVSVGSTSSPTPVGKYSITDGLVGPGLGPWYGCCVLALTGHQDSLPAGWIGGNRIAIHGTPGAVGGADSHGCLRASNRDMVSLLRRVPLGTPVFIRA